jgi:uncharacterized protein (DUF433 family)
VAKKTTSKGIEHKPSAYGGRAEGKAMIAGTRVRVSDIARLYEIKLDEMMIQYISEALPHLTREQIREALDYWRANRAEIDREIELEEALMSQIPAAW